MDEVLGSDRLDKNHIFMARQLGQNISKMVLWVVPGMQWSVPTKSGQR